MSSSGTPDSSPDGDPTVRTRAPRRRRRSAGEGARESIRGAARAADETRVVIGAFADRPSCDSYSAAGYYLSRRDQGLERSEDPGTVGYWRQIPMASSAWWRSPTTPRPTPRIGCVVSSLYCSHTRPANVRPRHPQKTTCSATSASAVMPVEADTAGMPPSPPGRPGRCPDSRISYLVVQLLRAYAPRYG